MRAHETSSLHTRFLDPTPKNLHSRTGYAVHELVALLSCQCHIRYMSIFEEFQFHNVKFLLFGDFCEH